MLSLESVDGYDTAVFTAVNVQIIDGSGDTKGVVNGLGNLKIGYLEKGAPAPFFCSSDNSFFHDEIGCLNSGGTWEQNIHTGSHNLILGVEQSYTSFGAIVAGTRSTITNQYSSVIGGLENSAIGQFSSVVGGRVNSASGHSSTVGGGFGNDSSGDSTNISGGSSNLAVGISSSISGGFKNQSDGENASINGGSNNIASSKNATVSGGNSRQAITVDSWAAGSLSENN